MVLGVVSVTAIAIPSSGARKCRPVLVPRPSECNGRRPAAPGVRHQIRAADRTSRRRSCRASCGSRRAMPGPSPSPAPTASSSGTTAWRCSIPGPDDAAHRAALLAAIGGRKVEAIILTHTHKDHSAGARALQGGDRGAAVVRRAAPAEPAAAAVRDQRAGGRTATGGSTPDRTFFDGERFEVGGVGLTSRSRRRGIAPTT